MESVIHAIFEPGLFSSSIVRLAAEVGAVVAIVTAVVGVFTVIRGQAFAGEALGDIGLAGGSSAYLVGVGPLWGFLASSVAGAMAMELVGVQRVRGRDLATGVVLGVGFGLAALFLYLGTTYESASGATIAVLFGSIFALSPTVLPLATGLGAVAVVVIVALYRPLLLASLSPDLAAARGIPVRIVGAAYLLALAVAVALAALTIGAILSTALLVGPAATALRVSARPSRALTVAAAVGVGCTWLGLLLSYDSYYWPPLHHGWPASFFIVTLVLVCYIVSGPLAGHRSALDRPRPESPRPDRPRAER